MFCSQYFQTSFLEWKSLYFVFNFAKIVMEGPINNKLALVKIGTE